MNVSSSLIGNFAGPARFDFIPLSDGTLAFVKEQNPGIIVPNYNRANVNIGVVHIGPGFFFRALIAPIMDEVMARGDLNWGISTVNMNGKELKCQLDAQDGLYTLMERNGEQSATRVIGSIIESHTASTDYDSVINRLANPDTKLITLTITEGGYKEIDGKPAPAVKLIVEGLQRRCQLGHPAPTIMSCDNMPENGIKLRNAVLAYAEQISSELKIWIKDKVLFPSTMVDRITPSTDRDKVENPKIAKDEFGLTDPCAVTSEIYRCWVIENIESNPGDIPADFKNIEGVKLTSNPTELELAKIRSLNGAHVALGMIGHLMGYPFARDAMKNADIKSFVEGFIGDSLSSLPERDGVDLSAYDRDTTVGRIANIYLEDDVKRLPRNGSDGKIQNRVLASVIDLISKRKDFDHHAFTVAVWLEYLKGKDADGNSFDIDDKKPLGRSLQSLMQQSPDDISNILNNDAVFNLNLRQNTSFREKVEGYYNDIIQLGMRGALQKFNVDRNQPKFVRNHSDITYNS